MNIPARYATGYLGDIGVPADPNPMDFSAWFEVFLQGRSKESKLMKQAIHLFILLSPMSV
jgi:transglutaminase-like putative cysteine protease